MQVELDMFSGQPNPRWQLDAVDEDWVAERIQDLLSVPDRVLPARPAPPGLGYRGFVFELDHCTWRAWRGLVWDSQSVLNDPTRSVEKFLLRRVPSEYATLRPRILEEIACGQ